MGWREATWKPSPHDYAGYWFNLRDWMTTSRARAALMSGGIVWRVCLEVLVPEDLQLVLLGPDYAGHGKRVRFDGEQHESWDNTLTEDDMDVISGVYKMYTGSGDQTADASWWPKQSIWQGSSMDLGYWSPQCEEWYKRRRDLITSGQARGAPKTATKWREALQGWKPRKQFINSVQITSASVLGDLSRGD
ncbi:hypothetical protein FIBSPDRAFT_761900 [Athelia psychrophila]|nr:hypothetical protein FIBSPDRAFT_761900 [Fibularhizoctonia sp. CBS 109695]